MAAPTLLSKILLPDGSTVVMTFSTAMETAGAFTLKGASLTNPQIAGNVITWTVTPRILTGVSLAGALNVAFSPTAVGGLAMATWITDSSPAGDVMNLSAVSSTTTDAIDEATQRPKKVVVDGRTVEAPTIPELIEADRYKRSLAATNTGRGGARYSKYVPPGAP